MLSLFDTTLEEWADYISFLNKLLKVRYAITQARGCRKAHSNPFCSGASSSTFDYYNNTFKGHGCETTGAVS